jgi:hypothetical protein
MILSASYWDTSAVNGLTAAASYSPTISTLRPRIDAAYAKRVNTLAG